MTPEKERELGEWMRRAQDGDREAYGALLRELRVIVRAHALRRGARADWVDDVVQETLISIHKARRTYDPGRPFAPWMYAIADFRLADALRKHYRSRSRETDEEPAELDLAVTDAVDGDDVTELVRQAVSELPGRQREVVEMLKLEEMSVKEVARRLNMSESNVKVTAHRGYKRLRESLRGLRGGK